MVLERAYHAQEEHVSSMKSILQVVVTTGRYVVRGQWYYALNACDHLSSEASTQHTAIILDVWINVPQHRSGLF